MHHIYHYDPTDPMGFWYDPLPENATQEDYEELQRLTMKMLWRTIVTGFVLLAALAVCSLFTSCATQKQEHQQQTHVVQTDTAGTEQSYGGQVADLTVNVDSIVNIVMQRTREEFSRQEQEHETTTETTTETIDSLGRIVRQTQKTTDRTLSRQEQQRIDRLEQTFSQQLHRAIQEHDSLWQNRFAEYQTSMRDSLQSVRDLHRQTSASNPLTWWQQFRLHLANILIYFLAICAVVFVFHRWLKQKKTI